MDHTQNSTTRQHQALSFPILKIPEILHCMSELGIDLTADELNEPHRHKERVRAVFVLLIELGLSLTEDDLRTRPRPVLEKRASLLHPELHEESLRDLRFYKSAASFMRVCGMGDFEFRDLQAPTARRFRRQLSGAINFARFREERMQTYDELMVEREEIVDLLHVAIEEGNKQQFRLSEAKLAKEKDMKEIEEVENDCAEIETEIAQQNKLQAAIRQESTDLKKRVNDLKDKLATATLMSQEAKAEERALSSQVAKSPERIKRELDAATKSLREARGQISDKEDELDLLERKLRNVTRGIEDVERALSAAKEAAVARDECESKREEETAAADAAAAIENRLSELRASREEWEKRINAIEENNQQMRMRWNEEMHEANEALAAVMEELEFVEKDREEGMARVEAGEAEVRKIEKEMEKDREKANAEIAEMMQEYRLLEAVVLEKDNELMQAIGAS